MAKRVSSFAHRSTLETLSPLLLGLLAASGCREYECVDMANCNGSEASVGTPTTSNSTDASLGSMLATSTPPITTHTSSFPGGSSANTPSFPGPSSNHGASSNPGASSNTPTTSTPASSSSGDEVTTHDQTSASDVEVDSVEQSSTPTDETSAPVTGAPSEPVTTSDELTTPPAPSSSEAEVGNTSAEDPSDTGISDVAPGPHCASVADWDLAWSQWEEEVLQLVNDVRAVGADCDSEGSFGPTTPLAMDSMLRCSSRLHSEDMYVRDFFDHTNPDGLDPFERMDDAGFNGGWMGENIAYGQPSPEEVMKAWVDSDGHCSNIMNPNFTLIGVGYYPGGANWQDGQHFWTQNFGTPLN